MTFPVLFAQVTESNPILGASSGMARDILIVLGAILFLAAALLTTIWLLRRNGRHHRPHRSRRGPAAPPAPVEESEETDEDESDEPEGGADDGGDPNHRRRRRRKRDHRGRNPTLAETGGLPPPRPEGILPPLP